VNIRVAGTSLIDFSLQQGHEEPERDAVAFSYESSLGFELPSDLEAWIPPEALGFARDSVRLQVSYLGDGRIFHGPFNEVEAFLRSGDILVINTSGTLPARLPAFRADATTLILHLSTRVRTTSWIVEVRLPSGSGTRPYHDATAGEMLYLPGGGSATLLAPHRRNSDAGIDKPTRLWRASLRTPLPWRDYLLRYGTPIRYSHVTCQWPLEYYQTVYATEQGSAEMPSAGRAFTHDLLARLRARGIRVAPLLLHTGVASLEQDEPPYEEFYRVPARTAELVNATRRDGKRVIAVGTTVVRALETAVDQHGSVCAGAGWTDLVITRERGLHAVDALLTGFHEPRSSHLMILEALAGPEHLRLAYAEALRKRYLWHEFGDLHLILPGQYDEPVQPVLRI
jgi:S-adenosylmethionine:tRNA ribosyltransferase-isomerase